MTHQLVSLGDLVIDLIASVHLPIVAFQHQESRALQVEPGGSGNFLIMAARLGLEVLAVGAVGDDIFGTFLLDVLRFEGVDTSGVTVTPNANSAVVFDLVDHQTGQHVFIGNKGDDLVVPFTGKVEGIIAAADALFFQGYALVEQHMRVLAPAAIQKAYSLNIPIYFDVGPTVRQLAPEDIRAAVELTTVLMMTEDEVPLAANGMTGEEAYRYLLGLGPGMLVIKQGSRGCTIIQPNTLERVPGFSVPVSDTIGAGDCFDAAFIYGQLRDLDLRASAILANAAGAASVSKIGAGRNVPNCTEVKALLKDTGIELPC